jgi:septal ring-binding cell division protein DamX
MIPALLGIPVVEGVVGGVVGSVANLFSPSQPDAPAPAASPISTKGFTPYLNNASAATAPQAPGTTPSIGSMRADEWGQMAPTDVQSWAKSLVGKHVTATDQTGRTISGDVSGMQMLGNTLALNVGGHLVSLSQLKQITWAPSVA